MAEYAYLKPKVKAGKIGVRERNRGMFVNVPGYVRFGGLTSADKIPMPEASTMSLEKTPQARSGKPI
jgi:hypothetical protein